MQIQCILRGCGRCDSAPGKTPCSAIKNSNVSLSVEYVLELYRVRMKARGFYVKGVPCLPANQSLTMALYGKCVSTHRVSTLFLILEFFALICNNDRDQFFSNRDTKEAIFKDSK